MKKINIITLLLIVAALMLMALPIILLGMDAAQIGAYIILPIFLLLAMAIAFVLAKKSRDAMADIIDKQLILSWQMPENKELRKRTVGGLVIKNALILLLCLGALCGLLIYNNADLRVCLCLAGGLALLSGALVVDSTAKSIRLCGGLNGFKLGHSFLCIAGKFTVLDGMRNAVYKTELDRDVLTLGLMLGGKENELPLTVPAESLGDVRAFIDDLSSHLAAHAEEASQAEMESQSVGNEAPSVENQSDKIRKD